MHIQLFWSSVTSTPLHCCCSCCSIAQSCPVLCNPMDCSMPGFPVHHQLPELAQTHVHQVSDAIQPILASVVPFSSCLQSFPASGPFPVNQFFTSGGQSIGASASASVLPVDIQGWFPLGLTDLTVFFNVGHLYSHFLSFLMLIFLKNMVL